jgi:hypothetical protein
VSENTSGTGPEETGNAGLDEAAADESASSAGSESPEEGSEAMDAAEDAVSGSQAEQ